MRRVTMLTMVRVGACEYASGATFEVGEDLASAWIDQQLAYPEGDTPPVVVVEKPQPIKAGRAKPEPRKLAASLPTKGGRAPAATHKPYPGNPVKGDRAAPTTHEVATDKLPTKGGRTPAATPKPYPGNPQKRDR